MSDINCEFCHLDISPDEYPEHYEQCQIEQLQLLEDTHVVQQKSIPEDLPTDKQLRALDYAVKKSRIFSKNITDNLKLKFLTRGLTDKHYVDVINYVQNKAPLIIHVNLDRVLEFFCKDDYYRNQFETNISGGALSNPSRVQWEDNLFQRIYHDAQPFERVKYGTINMTNDPNGVNACYGYGDSYLLLKDHMRQITTFVFGDSAQQDIHMATFQHFNSILYYINDKLLDDVVKIASGEVSHMSAINCTPYIEAQIHGAIRFDRDVEGLYVNKKYYNNYKIKELLEVFKDKHGCNYHLLN